MATRMITQWIKEMPEIVSIRNGGRGPAARGPVLRGNVLALQEGEGRNVSLTGLDGRRHALTELSKGNYRLPSGLPAGMYFLKSGARTFKLML